MRAEQCLIGKVGEESGVVREGLPAVQAQSSGS